MRSARGLIMLDVAAALTIVTVLTIGLAVTVAQHQRALARLADSAQAARLAERALAELQSGGPATVAGADLTVEIRPVDSEHPPAGWRWVRITVGYRRGAADLTGLVPAAKEPGP